MIGPEETAARLLRDWLLEQLPASIATVNAARAASLRAPQPGPYTIPAACTLKTSITDKAGTTSTTALTSGSRTTAQLVTQINTALGATVASADTDDHLVLTSTTAPSYAASSGAIVNSVVAVGVDTTGANVALGWSSAGEAVIRTALVPPGPRGVCDGLPLGTYFDPSQIGKGRVLVTIGAREGKPKGDNPRNFEWDVALELGIFRAEPLEVTNQTREPIQAALRAVRAVLMTDSGKSLGPAGLREGVGYGRILSANISGQSLTFTTRDANGNRSQFSPFFDAVNCRYLVRVYQAS